MSEIKDSELNNDNSHSYLMRKRNKDIYLKDKEVLDYNNKKVILKKICDLREEIEEEHIKEKYKKLILFLESCEIGIFNVKKFSEISDLKNISDLYLLKKNDKGYLISYKSNFKKTIFIYKIPKLIGKIFNNNLSVDICYSDLQSDKVCINNRNFDFETYAILNNDINNENIESYDIEMLDAKEILYIINNKINFDLNMVNKENLFTKYEKGSKKENPFSINLGYFYYINTQPIYQKNYFFIKTKKRMIIIDNLINFIVSSRSNTYYITGPRGIGKTATLIYFSSLQLFHIFYVNLKVIFSQIIENTKKMMKYEIMRFFSSDYDENNEHIIKINDLIEKFEVKNIQNFLNEIVKFFSKFYDDDVKKVIILDQFNNDISNLDFDKFLDRVNYENNFRIIIPTSLGNDFAKKGIENILDYKKEIEYKMTYYSNILNDEENISIFLEDEKDKIIKNEICGCGNIPEYYYELKENNITAINNNLANDIKKYIKDDLSNLIELLILIKNKYLFNINHIKNYINCIC